MDLVRRHTGGIALDRAAYQARERLTCPLTGEQFDHADDSDLVSKTILGTACSRTDIWTKAEVAERRQKAVLARSFKLALPWENTDDANWDLLTRFGLYLGNALNTVVDVAFHKKDQDQASEETQNPHAHLLVPTRAWVEDRQNFGAKTRVLDDRKTGGPLLKQIRKTWEEMVNQSLPVWAQPICCESHAELGDGLLPKKHLGRVATELERKGFRTRTGDYNELVEEHNGLEVEIQRLRKELSSLEQSAPEAPNLSVLLAADTAVDGGPVDESLPVPAPAAEPIRAAPTDDESINPLLLPRSLEEEFDEALASAGSILEPDVSVSTSHHIVVPDRLPSACDLAVAKEPTQPPPDRSTLVTDSPDEDLDLPIRPRTLEDDSEEAIVNGGTHIPNAPPPPSIVEADAGTSSASLDPGTLDDELDEARANLTSPVLPDPPMDPWP